MNSEKIWTIWKKGKLNCEKIRKIWKKAKFNSEKIWKVWKKSRLNCEMMWKIWKKGKLNSEMIWKIWKISVLVINTPKETSSSISIPPPHPPPLHPALLLPPSLPPSSFSSPFLQSSSSSPPSLYTCIYIVFQNWEESSWNSFLLETMQVGIKFTISLIWLLGYLLEIPQWEGERDRKHPWSTTQHLEHSRKNGCAIIEGAPHENIMAGKGQITIESLVRRKWPGYRTWTS